MTAPLGREQTIETMPGGTVIYRVYYGLGPNRVLRKGMEFTTMSGARCVFQSAECRIGRRSFINALSPSGALVQVDPAAVRTVHRKPTP